MALEVNGTAVKVLGDEALKKIIACFGTCENQKKGTCQLTDWTGPKEKSSGQGPGLMSARFKKSIRGYPSDKQEKATPTVLEQEAELIAKDWIGVLSVKKILKLPVP
jgi:hypothetical protein